MTGRDDKRQLRKMKRDLKRDGRRQHRRDLKQQLESQPDTVEPWEGKIEYDHSTEKWNGTFKDTKRKRLRIKDDRRREDGDERTARLAAS